MTRIQSKRGALIALVSILLLSACVKPDPADVLAEKLAQVAHYQELWSAMSASSEYSFSYQRNCFCPYSGERVRIDVADGVVKSFSRSPDSKWPEHTPEHLVVTMEDVFAQIEVLAKREGSGDGTLGIEFDESAGNPTMVSWADKKAYENEVAFALRIELVEHQ